jgi:calcineurin-like phosphoesterase family protein
MPAQSKKTVKRSKPARKGSPPSPVPAPSGGTPPPVGEPHFGEPTITADPSRFVNQKSDLQYYKFVIKNLSPIPPPRDPTNPTLNLETAWGKQGPAKTQAITKAGQIVFHSVGDTGSTLGPQTISAVADKMVADFTEANPPDVPSFFFHLGDVVYSFGETQYYYDQFYDPYRNYNAPIFAIPGNHDGMTYKSDVETPLTAFLRNFCSPTFQKTPEAGSLWRTAMIQPSVYFTLDAPFVRIIGLYSNVLEDPGVISSEGNPNSPVNDQQLKFLGDQLRQIKAENYPGAVLIAVHHPPFTGGSHHGGSPRLLQDIDNQCQAAGVYPHAVLSGHAHNYQRYTRAVGQRETPYVVVGCGGHNIAGLSTGKSNTVIRTPLKINPELTLESYFDDYGYLRVLVTANLLRIEFHSVGTGLKSKSPFDVCAVDLKTRRLTTSHP